MEEILEADSLTDFLQTFTQPPMIFFHKLRKNKDSYGRT
jgi:hypothetical protein